MRSTLALLGVAGAILGAGCGSSSKASKGADATDKRAAALNCFTSEQQLHARALGTDSVQVGDPATGARIKFFLTGPEAEAAQFEGRYEGSEQIGPALLFVRRASDQQLQKVETCLDEL